MVSAWPGLEGGRGQGHRTAGSQPYWLCLAEMLLGGGDIKLLGRKEEWESVPLDQAFTPEETSHPSRSQVSTRCGPGLVGRVWAGVGCRVGRVQGAARWDQAPDAGTRRADFSPKVLEPLGVERGRHGELQVCGGRGSSVVAGGQVVAGKGLRAAEATRGRRGGHAAQGLVSHCPVASFSPQPCYRSTWTTTT